MGKRADLSTKLERKANSGDQLAYSGKQRDFKQLKEALIQTPALSFPNLEKLFQLYGTEK